MFTFCCCWILVFTFWEEVAPNEYVRLSGLTPGLAENALNRLVLAKFVPDKAFPAPNEPKDGDCWNPVLFPPNTPPNTPFWLCCWLNNPLLLAIPPIPIPEFCIPIWFGWFIGLSITIGLLIVWEVFKLLFWVFKPKFKLLLVLYYIRPKLVCLFI